MRRGFALDQAACSIGSPANRPTQILHQTSTGTTLAEYQYSYDGVSNVLTCAFR